MVFREFASHASIADRVASRVASQKSFCESRLKRDSQKLFCDATRDATDAKPGKPQIAAMSHPTQLPQLGHRRPSQKLSLAQLLRCDLFIYLFIQHLLARPKTANKHERSGDSQPRQAKREKKKKDAVREGKEIGRCDATSDLVYDFDLFYSKVVQRCKSCL